MKSTSRRWTDGQVIGCRVRFGRPSRQSHYCRDKQSGAAMGRQTGNQAATKAGSRNHAGISWAGEPDGAIRTACLWRAVVFGLRRAGRRLPAVTLRWQRLWGLGAGVVTQGQECRLRNVTGKCPALSTCKHCNTKVSTALQSPTSLFIVLSAVLIHTYWTVCVSHQSTDHLSLF